MSPLPLFHHVGLTDIGQLQVSLAQVETAHANTLREPFPGVLCASACYVSERQCGELCLNSVFEG